MEQNIFRFKVCVFGDGGVGKTTLINKYTTGVFKDGYLMTIGMDFHVKKLNIDEKDVTLHVWDFAGEDRFRFLLPSIVSGALGIIFVYDITRYASLKNLKDWVSIFRKSTEKATEPIQVFLVGSKLDLESKRSVSKDDGVKFANDNNFQGFFECSSKTGKNVQDIFNMLAKKMLLCHTVL